MQLRAMVCAVALLGCGKTGATGPEGDDPTAGAANGTAGNGGAVGHSGGSATSGGLVAGGSGGRVATGGRSGTSGEGGSAQSGNSGCVTEAPPDAPIRRLNRFEYENSLRTLFGDQTWATDALPPDPYEERTAALSPALVEAQHRLAKELAFRVTQTESATSEFTGCDAAVEGEEDCRDRFIGEFVERAFRRPPTASEIEQFASTFDDAAADGDFALGVRAVIQVALQSPEFLYLPEFGVGAPERAKGWARRAPYEMASRLSYFLWGSPPDAELLRAAGADALRSPEELEAQARRLLRDGRAAKAIGYFYLRLLQLDGASFPAAGLAEYPSFTPEIASHLLGETEAFVADATLSSGGDFRALLTAPHTFVNEPLASFYGLDGVAGDEFRHVEVDPTRRGGLLTHASFLAATAKGPFTDPSERGNRIAAAFLCLNIPPHPTQSPVPGPLPPNTTTRQRYAAHVSEVVCAACHVRIDPLGLAFEHYDAAGLYRDVENGVAIDATGRLMTERGTFDVDGALELADRLANSDEARRCFVQNWLAFSLGRAVTPADDCHLSALEREFVDADTNLQELLVAVLRNDAFLYRPEVAP